LCLKLDVDHVLELVSVFLVDKSIVEDSHDLVAPKLDNLVLVFIVVFISQEEALEDLRNVTHVVDVMCLLGRWQEICHALVEDVDRGDGQEVI